jgi:uncharacterized protein YndB with AHSA1/START domain
VPRPDTISVDRLVPASREAVFAFLADLGNHWALADAAIEVVTLERSGGPGTAADGGRVRLRGPLGIHRTVVTRVDAVDPPASIAGTALVGDRTRARVRWELAETEDGGTRVTLFAVVGESSRLDRLLLRVGGRAWLQRRLGHILGRLEEQVVGSVVGDVSVVGGERQPALDPLGDAAGHVARVVPRGPERLSGHARARPEAAVEDDGSLAIDRLGL